MDVVDEERDNASNSCWSWKLNHSVDAVNYDFEDHKILCHNEFDNSIPDSMLLTFFIIFTVSISISVLSFSIGDMILHKPSIGFLQDNSFHTSN